MAEWKRIEPTTTTKVGWRVITTKTFETPSGDVSTFDVMYPDGQEFACVIALTKENKVLIAREFCQGPELTMNELPGGFVDQGEDVETAVRREFLEETGYSPGTLKYLGAFHKDKYLNATWHAFFATECTKVQDQVLEQDAFIDVIELPIATFLDDAKNDKMTDHGAILMAYDELLKIKEVQHYETTNQSDHLCGRTRHQVFATNKGNAKRNAADY
jgi:ADP-ribose pyrophosphatase